MQNWRHVVAFAGRRSLLSPTTAVLPFLFPPPSFFFLCAATSKNLEIEQETLCTQPRASAVCQLLSCRERLCFIASTRRLGPADGLVKKTQDEPGGRCALPPAGHSVADLAVLLSGRQHPVIPSRGGGTAHSAGSMMR